MIKIGNYNLTEEQFSGKEKIEGDLYLRSVTSIPEGFNPTVGGYLDLRSVTSIPEGFNPTVGGYLDLGSVTSIPEGFNPTVGGDLDLRSVTSIPEGFNPTVGGYLVLSNSRKRIGSQVKPIQINRNFFWNKNGKKYAKIDGIFCEILSEKKKDLITILSAKKINKEEFFYIANKDNFYAHGDTLKKAISDLEFKVIAEKLKAEPINPDTLITPMYYRIITGACEMGVNEWLKQNNLTDKESMRADELLPILQKSNAYALERFKSLISWL